VVGIANRVEALQFVNAAAIGVAGAALVGQNLGAGRPDRAVRVIRTGLVWGIGVSLLVTATFMLFPASFIGLFSHDSEVLRIGVPYLRVLAGCMVFVAIEIVIAESILGSGHTAQISWIYTVISLIRIPLAFLVPRWTGSGTLGIAWLISVTCAVRALWIVAWAARGTWKSGLQRELSTAEVPIPGQPGAT
jgi:Na+-driven multidrug efflux pump